MIFVGVNRPSVWLIYLFLLKQVISFQQLIKYNETPHACIISLQGATLNLSFGDWILI